MGDQNRGSPLRLLSVLEGLTSLLCLPPGDDICINADFENTCSRIVVPKAAIVAKHTYLANGQTKVFSQKLSCVRGNHITSGMSESWRGKTLRVRKIKPSILGCNILRVEYFLQVSNLGDRAPLLQQLLGPVSTALA